jgi:hypothetical protein
MGDMAISLNISQNGRIWRNLVADLKLLCNPKSQICVDLAGSGKIWHNLAGSGKIPRYLAKSGSQMRIFYFCPIRSFIHPASYDFILNTIKQAGGAFLYLACCRKCLWLHCMTQARSLVTKYSHWSNRQWSYLC